MKYLFAILFTTFAVHPLLAQQGWLQPTRFSWQPGEKIRLNIRQGGLAAGLNWQGNHDSLYMLRAFSNNYQYDLLPYLGRSRGDSVSLDTLIYAGNFTLTCQGARQQQTLQPAELNALLETVGDTLLLERRLEAGAASVSIQRQWNAQALVRLKSTLKKSDYLKNSFIAMPTGLQLELVPLDNPYNLKSPGKIPFNVYMHNRLLSRGLLRVWHLEAGKMDLITVPVLKGLAEIPISPVGRWLLSLTHLDAPGLNGAQQWECLDASLSFGFE